MTTPTTSDVASVEGAGLTKLRATFDKAVKAWNADGGPHEHTIKAGEDLYFAAHNLIDELTEQRAALVEALRYSAALAQIATDRKTTRRDILVFTGRFSGMGSKSVDEILDMADAALQNAAPSTDGPKGQDGQLRDEPKNSAHAAPETTAALGTGETER